MSERFRYEECKWGAGKTAEDRKNWYDELERMGPENVRATLAAYTIGSRADIAIGECVMTKGFAQEWLAWHDAEKTRQERAFRTNQIYWTRWAAWAATGAAVIALLVALGALTGWLIRIL
jgi:hypothetical protein